MEQTSLFPKADQVIGSLENYAHEIADQITRATDVIKKKEAEIQILQTEFQNVRKSIKIAREEMTSPTARVLCLPEHHEEAVDVTVSQPEKPSKDEAAKDEKQKNKKPKKPQTKKSNAEPKKKSTAKPKRENCEATL